MDFKKTFNRGFTLLEMMVVIAIFLIMTAVVMTDIPSFKEAGALDLVSQEVATYIRGAQVYGTSLLVTKQVNNENENYPAYGIRFAKNSSDFYLYPAVCDSSGCHIPEGVSDKENYVLPSRFTFTKICHGNNCNASGADILYRRPRPEAIFKNGSADINSGSVSVEIAMSYDQNNSAKKRCVTVYKVGQIKVSSNPCP